ncbi:hypothetical protein Q4601_03580 [Shewanella sp. 1_MG-2023]|uniref:hypothetical protein n=1 Tax=unclassified Shewanella TaxID=196818 RepID=UPI0026E39B65|nr:MULTISPECIES: hypothetical protein [unclassified Shewanella]MDO6610916.1 hypothetical protein [Shewanella sp. 7_MG-2023]MDO6770233.1 hypothetical protein [Shewanella sp. 2_MG-2023]MDO6793374.1 hypothetical protein [Shewanella sp. 1_MG-2023]
MNKLLIGLSISIMTSSAYAEEVIEKEVQDMSDPLAVYTQVGGGITDAGLNLKLGQTYDTNNPETMGMNIIEVKGFAGELTGWNGSSDTNSIDSMRFRNFGVDLTNGRGSQFDAQWDFASNQGSASYSFIQALPKMGPVNLYPLAGAGIAVGEPFDGSTGSGVTDRYDMHGSFYVVGMYSKIEINDKIWLNYNPMFLGAISGSEAFKSSGFSGDDSVLTHEFAVSYQFTPTQNLRLFANWDENTRFAKGEFRVEYNKQL